MDRSDLILLRGGLMNLRGQQRTAALSGKELPVLVTQIVRRSLC